MKSLRLARLIVCVGALAAALASAPSVAQQVPLQKVRLAVGTTVLNVGYPMLTLAATLGYWKAEGYDVELIPVGASLQAIQQMVAGNAEFAEVNASVIVQSNVKNDLPVRIVMANGVIDWAVAVDADGPIRSIKDLKGKTLGVFSLATGGIAYLNSYLRANGLDPARDLELLPLGLGAPPVEALRLLHGHHAGHDRQAAADGACHGARCRQGDRVCARQPGLCAQAALGALSVHEADRRRRGNADQVGHE